MTRRCLHFQTEALLTLGKFRFVNGYADKLHAHSHTVLENANLTFSERTDSLQAGQPKSRVSIPVKRQEEIRIGSGAHSASNSMGTGDSFQGVKRP